MHNVNPAKIESSDDFLSDVLESVRFSELLMVLAVPVFLSLIYLLPESLQYSLVLNHENPSKFNLWSSAYVHRGFNHFINNLMSAFLFVPIYLLFVLSGERRLFRYIFGISVFIVPVVLALINIIVIGQGTGAGFSGIGSAIIGLLPVAVLLFMHNRVSERIRPSHGVVVFLIAAASIAFIYSEFATAFGISLVTGILTLHTIRQIGIQELRRAISELVSLKGYFVLTLFCCLMFLVSPVALFPQTIVQDDFAVNILTHYFGLVIGFFGPTAYLIFR